MSRITCFFRVFKESILKRSMYKIIFCGLIFLNGYTVSGQDLIKENFSSSNSEWKPLDISGSGSASISNGQMVVTPNSGSTFGVYNTKVLSGHFYAEVDFTQDANVGLALFKVNGTAPDLYNYTMITINNVNGKIVVSANDKQNGVANVLDCTNKISDKTLRYNNTLDGSKISVPWTATNNKIRLLRHAKEKCIHFYYQVKQNIKGEDAIGWAELSPSPEWSQLTGDYYVGLVAVNGQAVFDNVYACTKPQADKDDTNTGFAATWREMNWSGYFGKALVITFDKTLAPLSGGSRKFVFWSENNYVPAWCLDSNSMYTYEFVETWGGGFDGCHEPMSDRLLRFSNVTLLENTSSRKVVQWHYVQHNPDYKTPDDASGSQIPEADEYYYIYPDGTIVRQIQYTPKLDTQFRSWHELLELIVIAGTNTKAVDHLSNPALSIWPINATEEKYYPQGGASYDTSKNDATVIAAHFKNHPDVICVFNDNAAHPETYPGLPVNIYKSCHDVDTRFSHWPISKEQYWWDPVKNFAQWPTEVSHTSIAGAGVYGGTDWSSNYFVRGNGRKYREWLSLLSLTQKDNIQQAKDKTVCWLSDLNLDNRVTNSSFEVTQSETQTPSGWQEWNNVAASYTENKGGAKAGNFDLMHYSATAYEVSTNQLVKDIPNGLYDAKAFVKSSGGQTVALMTVKNYGGVDVWTDIPSGNVWKQIQISGINVTNNQAELSFYSKANAGNWINVDNVEFVPHNFVSNPGFEADNAAAPTPQGWTEWKDSSASYTENKGAARTGSYNLTQYSSSAFEVSTFQSMKDIPNGTYDAKAWVKSTGDQQSAFMMVKNYGGSDISTGINSAGQWTRIKISGINVTNNQAELSFYSQSTGGSWLNVDDVEFTLKLDASIIDLPTRIENTSSKPEPATLFRNADGSLAMRFSGNQSNGKTVVNVFDLAGKKVYSGGLTADNNRIYQAISKKILKPGLYIISIKGLSIDKKCTIMINK
jgi:hypothetical protein